MAMPVQDGTGICRCGFFRKSTMKETAMLKKLIASAAFLSVAAFGALPASAAEYIVDDDVVAEESDDAVVSSEGGSRVYGWTSERPLDCGAYHYWDGEDCVDARAVPPDTGRKD
jgi:hypothetical protein